VNNIVPVGGHSFFSCGFMSLSGPNRKKISVVIPTYRRPELLLRCIQALITQDFPSPDFEIIVVSDGYDADSYEAVGRFNPKALPVIKYFQLPRKGGPAAARNRGWQQALGELIAFTDDDCIPDRQWLSGLWKIYHESGKKTAAFTGRTIVPMPPIPTDYELNIAQLEKAEFITANCACTKKAMLTVGGLDERFTMAWREDSDLQFKFIEKNIPIFRVPEAVVTHPVRKAPWGVSIKEEKKGVFNALLYKKYPQLYKEKIQPNPPWNYYLILLCIIIFVAGLGLGNDIAALAGVTGWLLATIWFTIKRLSRTSHSIRHVWEMFATSLVIPFLSLYYRFYGALKYKVLLIP
jgi:glycosyltransferase involved in cell wall biosynthesis